MSSLLNYYRDDVDEFYLTGELSHDLYTKLREYYSQDIQGAFLSKTKYVLFVDADVTFTHKFSLLDCLEQMKKGDYDMMSTTPVHRGDTNIRASLLFFLNKISTRWLSRREPFAIGAFTLVKKEKFDELGGYDEEVKHTEDWLLSKKILPSKFLLITDLITQDDRRFRKFGYWRKNYL